MLALIQSPVWTLCHPLIFTGKRWCFPRLWIDRANLQCGPHVRAGVFEIKPFSRSLWNPLSYTSPITKSVRFISPSHCSLITGQIVVTSLKSLSLLTGKNRTKPMRILKALSCLCNSSKCLPRKKKISLLREIIYGSIFWEQKPQASSI